MLWENDLGGQLLDNNVLKDMVQDSHLQGVVVAIVVEILVGGNIVSNDIGRLPASEERESGGDCELDRIGADADGRGRDVSNLVTVVDVLSRGGENGLEDKEFCPVSLLLTVKC